MQAKYKQRSQISENIGILFAFELVSAGNAEN